MSHIATEGPEWLDLLRKINESQRLQVVKPWHSPPMRNAAPVHDHAAIKRWNDEVERRKADKKAVKPITPDQQRILDAMVKDMINGR